MSTSGTGNGQSSSVREQTELPISAAPPASTRVNVDTSPRADVDGVPTGVGGGALDALRHP